MRELEKYRNELSEQGYTTIFNTSKCLLTVLEEHGKWSFEVKCDYNCGTWYARV